MSDNVVKFQKDDVLFVCACGTHSFFLHATGNIECAGCGSKDYDISTAEWLQKTERVDQPDELRTTGEAGSVNRIVHGSQEFAQRGVIRDAQSWQASDDLALILIYNRNGRGSHWVGFETDEQRQWVVDKLETLLQTIKEIKL